MENYSLSDIAAVTDGNGFGGNNSWVLILLFAMIFGGGGFGYGKRDDASTQEILFGQQFQNLDNKLDRLGNGIADATFALNGRVVDEGRAMQNQLADCCCTTQRNIDSVKFDMSNYFAQSNANTTAQIQKVLDQMSQNKIESLQGRINQLELQNAVAGVVRYPMASTYSSGGNPFCGCSCSANMI